MTDTELQMPSGLSPSSIDLWLQCPRRFKEEKIHKKAGGVGIDAVVGTYVHRVLELLMQLPPADRTVEAASEFSKSAFAETAETDDFKSLGLTADDELSFRRRAWQSVRSYFEMERPSAVDVVSTEQKVSTVIAGVPIRGIIDRLDRDAFDDLVVVDYKSGKVPIPRFRGPKLRQVNLYGAMVEQVTGERPAEGRLVFTTYGETVSTRFSEESLEEAVGTAVDVWSALRAAVTLDEFPPEPGPLCGWCPFVYECPEGTAEVRSRLAQGKLKKTAPAYEYAANPGQATFPQPT